MFLKLKHYFGILCMGIAFSAWADNAPTLTDLGAQIKQNENNILTQIVGEPSDEIIGYFDVKSPKIHKKAVKNTYFVRKMLGKTENGDWVLQDFYFDDENNSKPLTSIYILPKKIKPQQKQIIGRFQADALALYRENGLPERIIQPTQSGESKVYLIDENGKIGAILHNRNTIDMFDENGVIKAKVITKKNQYLMQSWYENGQMRLNMNIEIKRTDMKQDSQMWYENGQLYYQNQDNKVQFWHENGKLAFEMVGTQTQAWDENGKTIYDNHRLILKDKMANVRAEMHNISQKMLDILNTTK